MKYCCANCFGDRGLEIEIIPIRSDRKGTCSYCSSEGVELVAPQELADYFGLLIAIYREDSDGDELVQWFKDDWAMFSHPSMDNAHAKELLSDILDDGEIVRKKFSPSEDFKTDRLDRWLELSNELKTENRFFPKAKINSDRFEELLTRLIIETNEVSTTWYRARIQSGDKPYELDEMSAPPRNVASHGRANPAGIPYLYLGSKPDTAVQPHGYVPRFDTVSGTGGRMPSA